MVGTGTPDGHLVVVERLGFTYPDGTRALDGITLSVAPGEKVALVGPNGAGKSTLLLHLNGILRGSGLVRVGDVALDDRSLRRIRGRVGLVFQNPDDQLFSPTVFDDVAFGPLYMGLSDDKVRGRSEVALHQVEMAAHAERMPHHLSLGEKKRVAIATVLSMEPDLLALDEPSSGLDPQARRTLIELLCVLPQAMLIASHDIGFVKQVCSRAILLVDGQVGGEFVGAEWASLAGERIW